MSKLIDIRFDASPVVEQTIEILTNDEPQDFMEKLQSGEYLTTMSFNSDDSVVKVLALPKLNVVGLVKRSENVDGTSEYMDFRFADEDDEKIDI